MARETAFRMGVASPPLDARSRHLRRLIIKGLDGGGRGHVGSAMSLIEILRVLYDDVLSHRPDDPAWASRDRCILSKGHGCLALYAVLAEHGYFPADALSGFCGPLSFLGGHPERGKVPGVEASTGALGHGLAIGVGMALGLKMGGRKSGVVIVMGDGEINEGSVWEAAMSAAKHRLGRLTAVIDYNKQQSYGPTAEVLELEPLADKWRSFGFAVSEVDGHDVEALRGVFRGLRETGDQPAAVICHTVKGKGIPFTENDPTWHHKSRIPATQIAEMMAALEDK